MKSRSRIRTRCSFERPATRSSISRVTTSPSLTARCAQRRAPALATSKWWKEERHGVFLDYNQNAKDRALLVLSERQEREGLGDAPWPPHYRKQAGEPARVQPSRRRVPKFPLVEIGRAQRKEDALAGLERWKMRHPDAAAHLAPADVLVDAMRGRFHTWTRIRVNRQHVPPDARPPQEALDPDDVPNEWAGVSARRR